MYTILLNLINLNQNKMNPLIIILYYDILYKFPPIF